MVRIFLFVTMFPAIAGAAALLHQYYDQTLFSDWILTAKHSILIVSFVYLFNEYLSYGKGITEITTTEYKLFKCRESGQEESFMMFADNIEELERFFEYSRPEKVVFIEEADIKAKDFQMKIYTPEYENRPGNI